MSGATDPMTCPKLGPWLGDEKVPYDGLVVAAVDHLGRNVVDCLSAGCKGRDEGRLLVTFGHDGPWNVDYPTDEHHFTIVVWGRPDGAVCDPASESQCHREDTCGRWADVGTCPRVVDTSEPGPGRGRVGGIFYGDEGLLAR
ncbi:hypothetical protein ACOZE6_32335, partial [Streptomyces koyangensis]